MGIVLVDIGLPELTTEQIENICAVAEETAHNFIQSQVSAKMIDALTISVEAEGQKPLNFTVEIDLVLTKSATGVKVQEIADKAVGEAYKVIEDELRKLK